VLLGKTVIQEILGTHSFISSSTRRKMKMKEKKKVALLGVGILILLLLVINAGAQQGEDPTMGQGMMSDSMMGQKMMGPGMTSMRMVSPRMTLMGMLHQWGNYFFTQKDPLGIDETQLEKIESVLNTHIKYAIRKDADRKIIVMEIEELLIKDKVDLSEVEEKVRALEMIDTDIDMEGIRTLEQALAVLTPEQRVKMKTLFKNSTFTRVMRMAPGRGEMVSPGGMMGGMMMKGSPP
jgi:Spy/CpxP family protein refolding chaperone